jgi:hypothetical protein
MDPKLLPVSIDCTEAERRLEVRRILESKLLLVCALAFEKSRARVEATIDNGFAFVS